MEAKLRFFSELYNILSVKSCCKPFKRLFNRLAHGIYYYRMLYRATIDRQKSFSRIRYKHHGVTFDKLESIRI